MPSRKAKKANLPLAMTAGNTVDIFRSKRIANIFFFFVSAAKASLLPFLTIYFRLLGLSPIQTGIVFGSQAIVMAIMVPFWLKISYLCNKKKLLMLCSIFILIVSHLALTGVPPTDRDESMIWCPSENANHSLGGPGADNFSQIDTTVNPLANTTSNVVTIANSTDSMFTTSSMEPMTESPTVATTIATTESVATVGTTIASSVATSASVATTPSSAEQNSSTSIQHESSANIQPASAAEQKPKSDNAESESATTRQGQKRSQRRQRRNSESQSLSANELHRNKRNLAEKLTRIQSQVYALNHRTFILVLMIVIVGEIFSCAAEKFADDAWFTLLDNVDDVEKYGSHKYWSAVAYIFYAVIVAIVVDTRECFLSIRLHHFMVHFYVFAGLLIMAFFTGIFYPFYPRERPSKHHAHRSKAKILCSDLRSFLLVFTIFLVGVANAGITCFLFWLIQDVGGSETQMGVVVMVRSITELFLLIFGKQIIHRLGIPFSAVIGLLAMVARLVALSFLWTPWAAVPIEILYGLSNTLLWQAICAHPDFSLNIITRRFTQNIFYILYYGLGASIGCIAAGYGYGYKSLPVVYQASAIVIGIWCVLFAISQKCLPKPPQVKYARLLADDEDSQSETDEDDWLEMALKNH